MGIHDGHREKMRRRFLSGGLEQFADHEALELLLYYAIPRRDTNPIAHALIDRYGSLSAVLAAPVEDLQKVEGIGESAAILLKLVPIWMPIPSVVWLAFSIFIGGVQAFIFTSLSLAYLANAVKESEE